VGIGVLALLALLGVVASSYLLGREAVPEASSYEIDLSRVRALAGSIPGPRPTAVRSALVGTAALPTAALFAGEHFEPHVMAHQVFQVVSPEASGLVDGGFAKAFHEGMGEGVYHADAFAAVQDAMGRADWIVVTHEHGDHVEGLARHPDPQAVAERVRWNRAQADNTERFDEVEMPAALRDAPVLDFERYHALAPGVVLIAAAGHTPGSQIVYVGLEGGSELLLIGDVAWHLDQIRQLHYRPRLVTDFVLGEDRAAVMAQFRTLHALDAAGELLVVPSHDLELREHLLATTLLTDGLE
jgi:glyoxylase-like metal-dependent hydrolase (beta-lactamase superfamily II)